MEEQQQLLLCHYDISLSSKAFQFSFCVGGVLIFYLIYGYCQELIFSIPGFKPFGWYLTLVQFAFYAIFAILETRLLLPNQARRVPLKTYFLLAFLTVGTMGMSNSSLGYLNYPTQVIFKCCKLIPVMLGGILIQGKTYKLLDFVACVLMSVGLTLFILADSTVQPKFHYIGVFFMCLALCSDAAIGNVQEKSMKAFKPSNTEVVLYSYGIGFFYILLVLCVRGTFLDGFHFYNQEPLQKYGYTFLFSLSGYLGITFVLTLIRVSGALVTVTVTTCRKALTIILSFLLFAKPFTIHYVWAGLIVLLGIGINVYTKNGQKLDQYLIMLLNHPLLRHLSASFRRKESKLILSV